MNTRMSDKRWQGMTLLETVVVIVILGVLAAMLLPALAPTHHCGKRISCVNNMKQLGTAYRVWENDNGDKYPMQQTETLGGMQEILSNSASAGRSLICPMRSCRMSWANRQKLSYVLLTTEPLIRTSFGVPLMHRRGWEPTALPNYSP